MSRSALGPAAFQAALLDEPDTPTAKCLCAPHPLPSMRALRNWSPWTFLRERLYPRGVRVFVRDLGNHRWGQTVWPGDGAAEIHLAHDLGATQGRCTLAHEIVHVLRGAPCRALCPDDEAKVEEATARWLLPIDRLARALAEFDIYAAAERLDVTRDVITHRLDGLTPAELGRLRKILRAA